MHDSRGASLNIGDRVLIEAEVTDLNGGDQNYCCCGVKVVTPEQPGKEKVMSPPTFSAMSTKFLTKVGAAILLALFAFAGNARADEPKTFLLPDGTVEQRVAAVESKTVSLEKRIADLEKKLAAATGPKTILESGPGVLTSKPQTFTLSPPAGKVRFSVCSNGKCTIHECNDLSQVPFGATVLSNSAIGSCPTGPCGDNCGCAGASSNAGAATAAPSGGGLFHRIRDRRAARAGCASCGN